MMPRAGEMGGDDGERDRGRDGGGSKTDTRTKEVSRPAACWLLLLVQRMHARVQLRRRLA